MPETSRTIPREQDAPRTLIVVMILLMLLGVGAAFFWIQRVGVAEEVVGRPAPLARYGPIFRFEEILAEPAKGNLLGRDVALWSAPVQRVTGNWLFWIGAAPARSVPVVLLGEQAARQHERQTVVRTGDTLAVFGTVRAVRGVSFRDEPWDLPQQEWERLARAQVYISALLVEHVAPRFPRAAVENRADTVH
ncbi:MAG: hypothetical protein ACRELV_01830 [Longimicrobiales bacterium]